jgi:hypothetical protein
MIPNLQMLIIVLLHTLEAILNENSMDKENIIFIWSMLYLLMKLLCLDFFSHTVYRKYQHILSVWMQKNINERKIA